ncbi:alpha/beta hydrolase [Lentilactobacillus sp. Marseille-Q4993]|uniref:alpha/beta hydrolase n=1 Tax=Lentilactobacillus sp. Marseille-Q4993 TaxID=3039492 RepID=UPI0024BBED9D|nr:alpha/beta hydrolase [Lentilactobacillus sp. Marseille-Q4993]
MKKKTKVMLAVGGSIIGLAAIGLFGAGMYFYQVAVVPAPKTFLSKDKPIKKSSPLYPAEQWYKNADKQKWTEISAGKDLKLDANYIAADKKTNKTVLIAHGFMSNKDKMFSYAYMFHNLGYNVLLPDARGHGKSQGNYIGFGWPERLDYKKWINQVIEKNGQNSEIVVFGVSMGGATTMMTSGVKGLPDQVKAFVEDCGYTNADAEISYQAKELYNMPRWPLVPIVSMITQVKDGYNFKEASSINQLKKNHKPMLFIHGSKDKFVPTKMVYSLYDATKGPKELWLSKGAAHAQSFQKHPKEYTRKVKNFLAKYVH